jgi:hypothetical protein
MNISTENTFENREGNSNVHITTVLFTKYGGDAHEVQVGAADWRVFVSDIVRFLFWDEAWNLRRKPS